MNNLADLLGALVECYPHPAPTPARMRAYRAALGDLDSLSPTVIRAAFVSLTSDPGREFYPSPGQIRSALAPAPTDAEIVAIWETLEARVIARRGYGTQQIEADFGPAVSAAVAVAGGVRELWGGEGRVFALKRFVASYREELTSPRAMLGSVDDRVAALVGGVATRFQSPVRKSLPSGRAYD